jgi:hypothetical protein
MLPSFGVQCQKSSRWWVYFEHEQNKKLPAQKTGGRYKGWIGFASGHDGDCCGLWISGKPKQLHLKSEI